MKFIPYKTVEQPVDGRLYAYPRRGTLEALIPTPFRSNHAVCMIELRNGDLLCVWFAGSDEGNGDISIVQSRFSALTQTWSDAVQITHDTTRAEQNPSLFRHPNGELWLVYAAQISRQELTGERFNLQYTAVIRRMISRDEGVTWSEPEQMFEETGAFCRQPIQILSSGRWIFGNWICYDDDTRNGSDISVVRISDDEGKTWKRVEIPESRGCVHANIVELGDGTLVALFRSRAADHIYRSVSANGGESWTSPEATELPNNNASIAAIALGGARIALIYNEQSFNDDRNVVLWPFERSTVSLAVSEDGGITWPWRRIVEPGEGFTGTANLRCNLRYEYPYLFRDTEGNLHLSYTYASRICMKHVIAPSDWVYGQKQVWDGECKMWV